MAKSNSIPRRIDKDLDDLLKEIARKNGINMRQASKELARITKVRIKGEKIAREIKF